MTLDYEDDLLFFNNVITNVNKLTYDNILEYIKKNPEVSSLNYYLDEKWKENQKKEFNLEKYAGNELRYLKKVLNGEDGPHGSWVTSLEQEFLKVFPGKYAIAMNSGTGTLHSALEAVGVGYKDEVITPALTVFMDTSSILHANAIPVYVDIDLETFNISPSEVEKAITKTKAIIAVSLYGLPHNISELDKISRKYNIPIIEDHAQTMLANIKVKLLACQKGLSSWSFESTKHLSSGEGGIL